MLEAAASFLHAHPYFGNAVAMSLALGAGVALVPVQAPVTLRSGLLALPRRVIWPLTLVPGYWQPRLVWGDGKAAIEGLLWSMATGGLAWLAEVLLCRPAQVPALGHFQLSRFALVGLVGAAIFLPLWALGVKVLEGFVVSVVGLGCILLASRPSRWRLAIGGAIGFGCSVGNRNPTFSGREPLLRPSHSTTVQRNPCPCAAQTYPSATSPLKTT